MKRLLGQGFVVVVVGVVASVFSPACADNDQSIFVRQVIAPPLNRQGGMCVYTSDPTQTFLFEGSLDVGVRDSYTANLLVGNQMIQRSDAPNTRVESNRVHINGAVVKVTDPNGASLGEFTSVASGFVDPQQNNIPSFGPVGVVAIDAATSAILKPELEADLTRRKTKLVIANIKVFGRTVGGVDVESGEFQFPIRVCFGCRVSFAGADDPTTAGIDCNLPLAEAASTQGPCNPGQDESIPCQICRGQPVCDEGPKL